MNPNKLFAFFGIFALLITSVFAVSASVNNDASASKVLTCSANGGNINDYQIKWFLTVDGKQIEQKDFENQIEIDSSNLVKGDQWTCKLLELVYDPLTHGLNTVVAGSAVTTVVNSAPVFTSSPVLGGNAASLYIYDSNAADADNDALTYSLDTASLSLGMTINSGNGIVSWSSPIAGTYPVTISVTDGQATTTQSYSLAIGGAISPLVITATATPSAGNIPLNVAFAATATGGTAPYTFAWDFTNDGTFDTVSQNPSFTYSTAGNYVSRLQVTDANSVVATKLVNITATTVSGANAPVISTTSCPDATVKRSYTCDISATGLGTLNYILVNAPSNMSIGLTNGVINWYPTSSGTYTFTVRVSDITNLVSTDKTFTIDVANNKATQADLSIDSISFDASLAQEGGFLEGDVSLSNNGNNNFKNLEITMSVDDLGLSTQSGQFDLNNNDRKTESLRLELPDTLNEDSYLVKFEITGNNVDIVKYKTVFIQGNAGSNAQSTSANTEVVVAPTPIVSSAPQVSTSTLNWSGIWFIIILLLLLLALAAYLVREISKNKEEKKDDEFTFNTTNSDYFGE